MIRPLRSLNRMCATWTCHGGNAPPQHVSVGYPGMAARGTSFSQLLGAPSGYYKLAICQPNKAGSVSSISRAILSTSGDLTGALGLNAVGGATVRIDGVLFGGAVVGAVGSATIQLDAALVASGAILASGNATISVTATLAPGALGWASGVAFIQVNGTLQPIGLGWVSGTTDVQTVLTAEAVASAVWAMLAASFNDPGTMGAKLNAAGSASNPWTDPTGAQVAAFVDRIKQLIEADEVHTANTVKKLTPGTSTVLLTKTHTGTPLVDLEVVR